MCPLASNLISINLRWESLLLRTLYQIGGVLPAFQTAQVDYPIHQNKEREGGGLNRSKGEVKTP